MKLSESRGFSLIELAITLVVMGLVLAFAIPAFRGLSGSQQLKGSRENAAAQLRLARELAIATGVTQVVHFQAAWSGSDYHTNVGIGGPVGGKWSLPLGITYWWPAGTQWEYRWTKDGRCMDSGLIVLQDRRGFKDTLSVQSSGMISLY